MKFLTMQEIADKVVGHMLLQNAKAEEASGTGVCLYRAPQGRACAAGCLIKDEHYSSKLEGRRVCAEEVTEALRLSGVDMYAYGTGMFVEGLQDIHDYNRVESWPERLKALVESEGLTFNPPVAANVQVL